MLAGYTSGFPFRVTLNGAAITKLRSTMARVELSETARQSARFLSRSPSFAPTNFPHRADSRGNRYGERVVC